MKIVFIVHYFPPLNSAGARRVLAFSKYLSRSGHQVSVITTCKSSYDGRLTESLPDYCNVIQVGRTEEVKASQAEIGGFRGRPWLARLLVSARRSLTKVFGQLIDHRIFFAFRFLNKQLPAEALDLLRDADILVSSCPPWPVHLAGYFAVGHFGKPWVADYRDQFSGNHWFPGNAFSAYIERRVEKLLLSRAVSVTVVSPPMGEYYSRFHHAVTTIENGYDEEMFEKARENVFRAGAVRSGKKTIRYMGTVTRERIPRNFLYALRALPASVRQSVAVEFYGESGMLHDVIQAEFQELVECIVFKPEVSYAQSLALMLSADALLFAEASTGTSLSAKGVLTTKLFEYLAVGRPIVADIAQETLAGQVIGRSGLGLVCSTDPGVIAEGLRKLLSGNFTLAPNAEFIESFSRENQAKRFEKVLEAAAGQGKR